MSWGNGRYVLLGNGENRKCGGGEQHGKSMILQQSRISGGGFCVEGRYQSRATQLRIDVEGQRGVMEKWERGKAGMPQILRKMD